VVEKASGAEARAAAAGVDLPERQAPEEAPPPEEPVVEAPAEDREAKQTAREQEAAERRGARDRRMADKKASREREAEPPEPSRSRSRGQGSPVDVNEASFEQLRELGLSVTEATRVIAYRERHDGFDAVDELETVPGLPKSTIESLRDQLKV